MRDVLGEYNLSGWIVAGIGVVLAGLSLWYIFVVKAMYLRTGLPSGVFPTILKGIEILLLAGFSIVLVYGGYWLAVSQDGRERAWWASLWTVLGLAGIVAIVALVTAFRVYQDGRSIAGPTIIQEFLLSAGAGALAGMLIGISSVKETVEANRSRDQRETLLFVNELLRHNVLNGMNVVLAYTDQIETALDESQVSEAICDDLETIRTNSETVVELTENVRALVQSVSGETSLETLTIEPILRQEVARVRDTHPEATIELDVRTNPAVVADELVDTVFANLLTNAVDHNHRNEPIVDVVVQEADDAVQVAVADNGPGIPDERKEAYFGPGEQDEGSVGQGLGLYLVDTLVERYDGEVWIDDNAPTGSVVTVELPCA